MFGMKTRRTQLAHLADRVTQLATRCDDLAQQRIDQEKALEDLRSEQTVLRLRLAELAERSDKAVTALLHRIEVKSRA